MSSKNSKRARRISSPSVFFDTFAKTARTKLGK